MDALIFSNQPQPHRLRASDATASADGGEPVAQGSFRS